MRQFGLALTLAISSLVACNRAPSDTQSGEGTNQTAPNTDLGPAQQSPRSDQEQQPGQMQPGQAQPGQAQPGQAQPGQAQPAQGAGDQAAGWRGSPNTGDGGPGTAAPGANPLSPKPEQGTRGTDHGADGGSRAP